MSLIETEYRGNAVWLLLDRPDRHNALIPDLVVDLRLAIAAAADSGAAALVLSGKGPSFSTGGDLSGFLDHAGSHEDLEQYSETLVEALHETILDLLVFPAPVLAAVNGPVTGGSMGLVLAADLVAMVEHAYLQPYYSEVGFGPDGGWTAMLPDRIGTSKTLEIQYRNLRIGAAEAAALGLAAAVCPATGLQEQIDLWTGELGASHAQSHLAARQSVWDTKRRDGVRQRLEQEKHRFLDLISRPETLEGMKGFLRESA